MQQKFAMNKALEQKLFGPMEESHTKKLSPLAKLLWGIVLQYVTPIVQLVFILVLYLLQIFTAVVTLFLSLHVKFIWFQVVLMLDIGSRNL